MKPGMKRPMLAAIAAAMSAMAVHAALAPAALFSDHCVLQRGKKVPVWGKANPGAAVTVSFAGQEKTATANADGQVSSGDYFHAQAALRAHGKNENLLPYAKGAE